MELRRCVLEHESIWWKTEKLIFFLPRKVWCCCWVDMMNKCLANSNKFSVTFSLLFTFIYVQKNLYWWSNQFVRRVRSFCLHLYISRPINLRYTTITSSVENYSFFFLSIFFVCVAPTSCQTIILSCVCVYVTQKQLLNIASIHDSSAYKVLLSHHLRSHEKLIDDDVKSDIINSIKP